MTRLVQLVLSGAKRRAPDRLLVTLVKLLSGALVQRFREVLPANSNLRPAAELKLARTTFGKPCTSAPDRNFVNIVSSLSGARVFAPESTSRTRELQ
jgi:hypothetical protein